MSDDVFFLGAGFSKSIISEYPTLQELSKEITGKFSTKKLSTKKFLNHKAYIDKYYNDEIPKEFSNNIEILLSSLLIDLPYKYPEKSLMDKVLYKDIIDKICKYFQDLDKKIQIPERTRNRKIYPIFDTMSLSIDDKIKNDVNRFAEFILKNKCTCITLNYDTLLEKILHYKISESYKNINKLSTFYKIPIKHVSERGKGYIKEEALESNQQYTKETEFRKELFSKELSINNKEPDVNKNMVPDVIKLHGSINWLYSENVNHEIYFNDTENGDFRAGDLEPFIIPPVLDKSALYSNTILRLLWQSAFEAIQTARNIYIYGFSFPETDYSIKSLFQEALKDRNDYAIYVINKCDNEKQLMELKKKYNDIFGKEHCNYYCCVEEGQLARLMDIMDIMDKRDIIDGIGMIFE